MIWAAGVVGAWLCAPATIDCQGIEVEQELEITQGLGGFTGQLGHLEGFGSDIAALGDLNPDGRMEIAVGAIGDADGGQLSGAVWILSLNADGTVASHVKISALSGNLPQGSIEEFDRFGQSVAALGDLDGDGIPDLAVGAPYDDDPGVNCPAPTGCSAGSVSILFLNFDGSVRSVQKISGVEGGFPGFIDTSDHFGYAVDAIGDLNGDGTVDLAVGTIGFEGPGAAFQRGAVWIVFLNPDGTVQGAQLISDTAGGLVGPLEDAGFFGSSVAGLGDLDGDGVADIAVGGRYADDGSVGDCSDYGNWQVCNTGAVWILFLNPDGTVRDQRKLSATSGDLPFSLEDGDVFGGAMAGLGDWDADGIPDLAVGAFGDDDGCSNCGAVYVLNLRRDGTIKRSQKISMLSGGLQGPLEFEALFGRGVATADLDHDSVVDLIVGALNDTSSGLNAGSIWELFLASDVSLYGCANPAGSLLITAGGPRLGTRIGLGVRNPLETQGAGSLPLVFVANAPVPSLPCGLALPGFHMDPSQPFGELLIRLLPPNPLLVLSGAPLAAPDATADISLPIPADPVLDGLEIFLQGLIFDPIGAGGVTFGLTEGLRLALHS